MEEDEYRWCKKCFTKTKQEIIFMPEIPTYKKRKYKCSADKHHGFKEEDHQLNQFTKL